MSHAPAPRTTLGLVVCVGLPSDQIIEIARLLRGQATVLATPDAAGARAALAEHVAPQQTEPSGERESPAGRYDNPGPVGVRDVGRRTPDVIPAGATGNLIELPPLRQLRAAPPLAGRPPSRHATPDGGPLAAGPLRVDLAGREVTAQGRRIYLSAREFDLLATLALEAGRVWSFAELTARVWRLPYLGDSDPVTSAVKRLRKRLTPVRDVEIASVRGVGYRLEVPH